MDAVTRAVASGEDLYALLGVPPEATDDDIRHAYRSLARRHHPDANPAAARGDDFRRIVAAYEVLGSTRERAAYDRAMRVERMASERATRHGPVASHVAPRPSGAVASRGPRASANPADSGVRVVPEAVERPREPVDVVERADVAEHYGRVTLERPD
jgi:curved DNA-binding protein CbpA